MTAPRSFTPGVLAWVLLTASIAAMVSALVVVRALRPAAAGDNRPATSAQPMLDAVDAFSCKKGLTRIVELRGVEDGFSRAGDEPSRIHPRLLRNGVYADLAEGTTHSYALRAYDEGGADRVLVDHVALPHGIVSGRLFLRMRSGIQGAENDGLRMGDLDLLARVHQDREDRVFGIERVWDGPNLTVLADGSALLAVDLAAIGDLAWDDRKRLNFLGFINRQDRSEIVDIQVGDDTAIDALALVACQLPLQPKGTTLAENSAKPLGPDVSWLACNGDQTQRSCDPFAGDRLCSVAGPVACYRDGEKPAPPRMKKLGMRPTTFVGGEVRLSAPERGDRFARLRDADEFCRQQFGAEWRVLSYHEGGGGDVVSYSRIEPGTRVLVNIGDQQYGNCWDRGLQR